jgi:hypothetical protein
VRARGDMRQHTSAYLCLRGGICQHTSAYLIGMAVEFDEKLRVRGVESDAEDADHLRHTSAYVSIRQHT